MLEFVCVVCVSVYFSHTVFRVRLCFGAERPAFWEGHPGSTCGCMRACMRVRARACVWLRVCVRAGVWVGTVDQLNPDGTVTEAYPTAWASTRRPQWGMNSLNTSDYGYGAAG